MLEYIAPFFIAFIVLCIFGEAVYSRKRGLDLYDNRDTATSVLLGVLGVATRIATKGINLLLWFLIAELSPFHIETSILSIALLFFLNEFVYYWFHRWSHELPFLWATHINHHSSLKMNFAVAARTPFLNAIYHVLFWIPLPLMGFSAVDILFVETISFFFAFVQHTTLIPKLGPLEWILNTPSHHRVHHSVNPEYINKNYGNVLIIFDRMFNTFEEEKSRPVYGINKNPINRSFVNMIFHGWRDLLRRN
ncbi:MAG: sterol desaturase family protein [bacterium]|nr:sterol desaturase family protein [bacterium]